MSPLTQHRSLPVQLRILVPVDRSERSYRLLRLIREHFPPVSCCLVVLGITENDDTHDQLALRRSFQEATDLLLADFHVEILVRSGKSVSFLVTLAFQQRCDCIILPVIPDGSVRISNIRTSVAAVLQATRLPVFLVPDTSVSFNKPLPFIKTLVYLNAAESSRISTAFALRAARLLSRQIILSASETSGASSRDFLRFVRDRYWPPDSADACRIQSLPGPVAASLRHAYQKHNPDFLILSLQDYSRCKRKRNIDAVKNIIVSHGTPVLVIDRFDWIAHQEKHLYHTYQNLTDFDLAHTPQKSNHTRFSDVFTTENPELFLGCYSYDGLNEVFRQYGLFQFLEQKGYPTAYIRFESVDRTRERFRVFHRQSGDSEPLVDLIVRLETKPDFETEPLQFPAGLTPFLHVEWLCLQDPLRAYRDLEIPLPGQKYPGLGIGWKVMIVIKLLARRIGAAGVYNMPEYYHTARLYHRFFRYVNPALEGRLLAIDRDTFPLHIVDTSWAFLHGLIQQNGRAAKWEPGPQILPIHPTLQAFFTSPEYVTSLQQTVNNVHFSVDTTGLYTMMNNRKLYTEPGIWVPEKGYR